MSLTKSISFTPPHLLKPGKKKKCWVNYFFISKTWPLRVQFGGKSISAYVNTMGHLQPRVRRRRKEISLFFLFPYITSWYIPCVCVCVYSWTVCSTVFAYDEPRVFLLFSLYKRRGGEIKSYSGRRRPSTNNWLKNQISEKKRIESWRGERRLWT